MHKHIYHDITKMQNTNTKVFNCKHDIYEIKYYEKNIKYKTPYEKQTIMRHN